MQLLFATAHSWAIAVVRATLGVVSVMVGAADAGLVTSHTPESRV